MLLIFANGQVEGYSIQTAYFTTHGVQRSGVAIKLVMLIKASNRLCSRDVTKWLSSQIILTPSSGDMWEHLRIQRIVRQEGFPRS